MLRRNYSKLLWVTLGVNCILGALLGIKIFEYVNIELAWKIAIITIGVFLPFFFFLLIKLQVSNISTERLFELENKFRALYNQIRTKPAGEAPRVDLPKASGSINPVDFATMAEQRDGFILKYDPELRGTYRQMLQLYYETEETLSETDRSTTQRSLLSLDEDNLLRKVILRQLISKGLDFDSYVLPLTFFLFTYFSGLLIILPFINSIFASSAQAIWIPLFSTGRYIPLLVVQWGLIGGIAYTSIYMTARFLRGDLSPKVYLLAAQRLLLSAIVAIIIYLSSEFIFTATGFKEVPIQLLLASFLAGVTPVQFLVSFADSQLSKYIDGWRRRGTPGNRPIIQLEGINSLDAQRLSEEGIACIHQMAFSDPSDLSAKTRYQPDLLRDWKDQALLRILVGDVIVYTKDSKDILLYEHLYTKLAIRNMSEFIKLWSKLDKNKGEEALLNELDLQNSGCNPKTLSNVLNRVASQGNRIISSMELTPQDYAI